MKDLIKRILREEVSRKFTKGSSNAESLIIKHMEKIISKTTRIIPPIEENYGNYGEEWCKNGEAVIEVRYYMFSEDNEDEEKFNSGSLFVDENEINFLTKILQVRKSYVLNVITEWYDEKYASKFGQETGHPEFVEGCFGCKASTIDLNAGEANSRLTMSSKKWDKELTQMSSNDARREFELLDPNAQEGLKSFFGDADYMQQPPDFGDRALGALKFTGKLLASPLIGLFKVAVPLLTPPDKPESVPVVMPVISPVDQMNAGHYVPVKGGSALRFNEYNVNGECIRCNGFDEFHFHKISFYH